MPLKALNLSPPLSFVGNKSVIELAGGTYLKVTWRRLYGVFTYIYSLLIKKCICDRRNVSAKLPCVNVCLSSGDLFIFSVRVSSFFSYFCVSKFK